MYLNKPPLGIKYPFLIFRRLINLLSLEIFIYRPNTNNKKPVIKNIDTECKLILLKKYPFINPFTMLKKNADKTIASGIFFPFVFILNGKIIVLLK